MELSKQANLSDGSSLIVVLLYLFYPLTLMLTYSTFIQKLLPCYCMVNCSRQTLNWQLIFSILLILSCKAVLSLTVIGMGIWLFFNEKGECVFALFTGIIWFIIATQSIIPHFNNGEVAAVGRYSFLEVHF